MVCRPDAASYVGDPPTALGQYLLDSDEVHDEQATGGPRGAQYFEGSVVPLGVVENERRLVAWIAYNAPGARRCQSPDKAFPRRLLRELSRSEFEETREDLTVQRLQRAMRCHSARNLAPPHSLLRARLSQASSMTLPAMSRALRQ